MKRLLFILIVISLFSCSDGKTQTESSEKLESKINSKKVESVTSRERVETKHTTFIDDSSIVNGSLGLLFVDTYAKNDWIVKNLDGSTFSSFNFSQEESKSYYDKLASIANNFKLFVYKPDYNLLVIQCNLTENDYVIVTKEGESKLITRANENYKFYTWAEFLISDRYVSIKENYNNIEETPIKFYQDSNEKASFSQFEQQDEMFMLKGVEVLYDWVKIKRESLDSDTKKPFYGWTKWREKDKLLIDFWFLL